MINVVKRGLYCISTLNEQKQILILDNRNYFVLNKDNKIEKLNFPYKDENKKIISIGNYRLYKVEKEPDLTDRYHLELCIGKGDWKRYLLPLGLPNDDNKSGKIIPTEELITSLTEVACPPADVHYEL